MRGDIVLSLLLLSFAWNTFAADNYAISDARSAAIGFASVSLASIDNPGGISLQSESFAGLHYENPYGIKELSKATAVAAFKNRWLDAGLVVSKFGYEKYGETRFAVNFSKKLFAGTSLGIRLNYLSILLSAEEGDKSVMSADVGMLVSPVEKLRIGIEIQNVMRTSYRTLRDEYTLPLVLRAGVNYSVAKELMLISEVEKSIDQPVCFKLGCEYLPLKEIPLRIGLIGTPYRPTFGVGYRISRFVFDVASVYHTVLGFHNLFSMQYKF